MNIRRIAIMGAAGLTLIGVGCESTKDSSPDPTNEITATVPTTKAPTTTTEAPTTTTTAPPTTTTTEAIDDAALVYGMMDMVWADTSYSDQESICWSYNLDPSFTVETVMDGVGSDLQGISYNDWYDGVDVYLWGVC